MNEFTRVPQQFNYKVGKKTYTDTVQVAPSVLEQALAGDPYTRNEIRREIKRCLRQGRGPIVTEINWCKIKWVD